MPEKHILVIDDNPRDPSVTIIKKVLGREAKISFVSSPDEARPIIERGVNGIVCDGLNRRWHDVQTLIRNGVPFVLLSGDGDALREGAQANLKTMDKNHFDLDKLKKMLGLG